MLGRDNGQLLSSGLKTAKYVMQKSKHSTYFTRNTTDKDVRVLGVSIDGKDKITLARDFVKRHDLTFPNLIIEPEMSEILKFGGGNFIGTPTFYIYTPDGEIVASQAGAVPVHIIEDFIQNWKKP